MKKYGNIVYIPKVKILYHHGMMCTVRAYIMLKSCNVLY